MGRCSDTRCRLRGATSRYDADSDLDIFYILLLIFLCMQHAAAVRMSIRQQCNNSGTAPITILGAIQ